MRFLLDDEDLMSVPLTPAIFKLMRSARRRIYWSYVREFRRESAELLRLRLRHIAGRGEWESLLLLLKGAARHVSIVGGFYLAWAAHGLGISPAKRISSWMLQGVEASFREAGS